MKKITYFLTLVALLTTFSCQKDKLPKSEALTVAEGACYEKKVPLAWAPEFGTAGDVTISNDGTNVYIKVALFDGMDFNNVPDNIRLWISDDMSTLPMMMSDCMPDYEAFPWKATVDPSNRAYTVTVPLSAISSFLGKPVTCETKLYIVYRVSLYVYSGEVEAHARESVQNCWYYWSSVAYQGVCCGTPPPPSGFSQTAFAKGGWVFTTEAKSNPELLPSLKLTKNRWGWAINIKPASNGTYEYNMYAGAGLNYVSKGTLVGKVKIVINGSNVAVTYTTNTGFSMGELHIYAGDNKPSTIAPGQYGYTRSFDPRVTTHTANFTLSDTNSDGLWFICHAGVFGKY